MCVTKIIAFKHFNFPVLASFLRQVLFTWLVVLFLGVIIINSCVLHDPLIVVANHAEPWWWWWWWWGLTKPLRYPELITYKYQLR